jgi:hypothetical protein
MSKKAQEVGREAEKRVVNTAQSLGFEAYYADPEDDYGGGKTDVFIEGIRVQVSVQPKSAQTRKRLRRKGVEAIAAGEAISDESLMEKIRRFLLGS